MPPPPEVPSSGPPARHSSFLQHLADQLDTAQRQSMRRELRALSSTGKHVEVDGRTLLNLAGNDYLGLATHPRLKRAAIEAIEALGTGSGASRLVTGHLAIHAEAERRFAAFKHAASRDSGPTSGGALLLPTGYMANLAVLTTLAGPGDLICIDKLTHASLIDAARASAAEVRVFPHLGYAKLERLLQRHRDAGTQGRIFIVSDSVFSMDGDCADLPVLCDLAERYDAITLIDEAHGTGVLGETGAGLAEAQGVVGRIDITVSTASKALGGLGGIVTAAQPIIDTLINRARPFIYTTAVPPSQAATLIAALDVLRDEPRTRQRLAELSGHVRSQLPTIAPLLSLPPASAATPILPLITGSPAAALKLAEHLKAHGVLAVAIRPPTVAPGSSRVRLTLRADLTDDDITRLFDALRAYRA